MKRAVLWLVGGLVGFVLLIVLIAPELLGDLRFTSSALGVTLAAVVPGLLVMAVFASSRRGRRRLRAEREAAAHAPATDREAGTTPTRPDDPEGA